MNLTFGSEEHGYVSYNAKLIVDKSGNKFYRDEEAEFEYIDTDDGFRFMKEYGKYTLLEYFGNEETVILPTDINENQYDIHLMRGVFDVIIPEGFTEIPTEAFGGCDTLVSVSIADSVEKIDSSAFWYCTNLQTVSFGVNSNLKTLGNHAFAGCERLNGIVLPDSIDCIPAGLFRDCYSLERIIIPDQCTSVGTEAFGLCHNLKSIYIGENVRTVSGDAFLECYFDEFVISPNNQWLAEKDGVIYNKNITKVFFALNGVKEVIIPASVTDINNAFAYHRTLEKVRFEEGSQLTTIGTAAFESCSVLKSVEIPNTVTRISTHAFQACAIETIDIPESVRVIDRAAFNLCTHLTTVTILNDDIEIDRDAFMQCFSLTTFISDRYKYIDSDKDGFYDTWETPIINGIVYSSDRKTIITADRGYMFGDLVIPEGVTTIQSRAFNSCVKLYSVTIPSTVTTIAEDAFFACEYLHIVYNNSDVEILSEMIYNLKVVIDKYGNKTFCENSDFAYVETADGFLFEKEMLVLIMNIQLLKKMAITN